jgi:hypothetical protein
MEVITTLMTAITAGPPLTQPALYASLEEGWLALLDLLGIYLLHGLHARAPGLFWGLFLCLFLPIGLMLLWAISAP